MAMPTFAAARAGASLTPSPVTATASPLSWRIRTSRSLSSGVARAITAWPRSRSASSSSSSASSAAPPCSTSGPWTPASRAAAATVSGWSPLTTIVRTPAWASTATASPHPGAQRIAERGQPHECEPALGVGGIERNGGDTALGHRDDSQPVVRELRDLREHGRPLRRGHRARLEDGLGRALDGHPRAAGLAPHRALAPSHRIERIPGQALARRGLAGGVHQRAIDRVLRGRCPVCGRRDGQHALAVAVDAFDLEPVLGHRPGLVGEQHGHRSDGLGGAQPAQENAVVRQAQTPDRHEHRHEDRQLLGDRREREREPVEEHLADGLAAGHADERHEHARRHRHDQRRARQLGHRALKRRGRLPGLRDQPPEPPDLGVGAERDDDALAGARHDGGPGVQQRRPLGERRVGVDRLASLRGRHGLARQPGLVGGQAVGLHDAGVGRHDAAGLDEQHVADHEPVDRDPAHGACPAHERGGGAEIAERLQRALRTDLGDRLDGADQPDHHEDRYRVAQLPEDRRKHADRDQQQLERLHQRLDQLAQDGRGAAAFGPSHRRAAPSRDLRRRQPTRATAEALPQDVQRLSVHRDDTRPVGGRCARHATNDTSAAQPEADGASGIMVLRGT